ncbi:MAG: DUF2867 domain-containing protein, partial [Sneathiella sp.]
MTALTPKVIADMLPPKSILHSRMAPGDFLDCFSVSSTATSREAAEIIVDFPWWARLLVGMRNILTSPFGLSADGPEAADKVGLFPVEIETASEMIAGFNDRHLEFRISVFAQEGRIFLATWVHPHNLGGKLYLRTILPFHILIARNALARVAVA